MSVDGWLAVAGAVVLGAPTPSAPRRFVTLGVSRGWGQPPRSTPTWLRDVRRRFLAHRPGPSRRSVLAAVQLLVAELEAGARPADGLRAAAEVAGPAGSALRRAADRQEDGEDAAAVLLGEPELALIGSAWAVSSATGVPLAEVLSGAARDLAARDEQNRAVATALASAQASAGILALLPLLAVLLGSAMGARPVQMLVGSPAGHGALAAGLGLELLGVVWTRRIAARARST